jgi:CBS-domain-containing membrane protein
VKNLTVNDVMTTKVLKARPAMPLKELARVLAEQQISALPVLDPDERLIGVVSEADLLLTQARLEPARRRWWWPRRRRVQGRGTAGSTVGDVMTRDPIVVGPRDTLAAAARRMSEYQVKRLPVVDERGALIGIVSRGDLLAAFLRSDDDIRNEILDEVFVRLLWVDPIDVDVTVSDGLAVLTGTVNDRRTAETAARLARRVDGVVDVVSELRYRVDDSGTARRRHPRHGERHAAAEPDR